MAVSILCPTPDQSELGQRRRGCQGGGHIQITNVGICLTEPPPFTVILKHGWKAARLIETGNDLLSVRFVYFIPGDVTVYNNFRSVLVGARECRVSNGSAQGSHLADGPC